MRPLRLLLLLACFIALPIFLTFISLVTAHPRNGDAVASTAPRTSGLRALFSFQTPSSLFPPSAMISLTDDNTTFFIAKPADFGPDLPGKGLNGQLWVGVGFGEDILRDDGVLASAEGELGCSDVPGWDGISKKGPRPSPLKTDVRKVSHGEKVVTDSAKEVAQKGGDSTVLAKTDAGEPRIAPIAEDGTDDHLHHPLPESGNPNAASPVHPVVQENTVDKVTPTAHADIQSLQESAEIAGKIVLLRRGGCGFLEKVKWAQRRGAIAVIVGDNARHGSLLTMYARGDTSNITIPSVFTSHTTAHLLSSLLPPEAVDDALAMESKPAPGYTNANSKPKSAEGDSSGALNLGDRESKIGDVQTPISSTSDRQSWIRSLLNAVGLGRDSATAEEDSRRPPSSGNIDWVLVEDFEDDDSTVTSKDKSMDDETSYMSSTKSKPSHDKTTKHAGADDFVIGEQDWRDPDLLKPTHKATDLEKDMSKVESSTDQSSHEEDTHTGRLKGGSITPGSGEYHHPPSSAGGKGSRVKGTKNETPSKASSGRTGKNWLGWLTTAHDEHTTKDGSPKGMEIIPQSDLHVSKPDHVSSSQTKVMHKDEDHEGLWITLTPTSMSTSPFLDTLLVLVVSPLVTLTVVYALLLLRSRIRRRRWRAPKSVVERLPVRTYHTMSTSAVSSQLSSPDTSSPTTPLLRATASTRTRPRSRTASSLPTGSEASDTSAAACTPPEKNRPGTAWRRRYTGRQVECVVCLEEYIDGQSRVMSLPCGHEFHVECITPWLTTRRRTCPICKGDVVRSMAQMGHYNNQEVDTQNSSDDFQDIAAEARNDSPSAAIPIPRGEGEADQDLERAGDEAGEAVGHGAQSGRRGWRNMLSLSALSGDTIWAGRQTPVDRNR